MPTGQDVRQVHDIPKQAGCTGRHCPDCYEDCTTRPAQPPAMCGFGTTGEVGERSTAPLLLSLSRLAL